MRKIREYILLNKGKRFIDANYKRMWVKDMAAKIGTTPHLVRKYMKQKGYALKKQYPKNKDSMLRRNEFECTGKVFNVHQRENWLV